MTKDKYDIIILGGGISSSLLTISILRKNPTFKILILEKNTEFAQKVGESTSDITALFLRRFDIDHLLKDHVQKTGLRFIFNEKNSSQTEDVSEFSSPTFDGPNNGFQLNRKVFDEQLLCEAERCGAEVLRPVEVVSYQFEEFSSVLKIIFNNEEKTVIAKWFVDASGRSRFIHHQLGWKDVACKLKTAAVYAHFTNLTESKNWNIPRNKFWEENAVGDGALSTLHFMRPSSWWWLIKIDPVTTSIGWVYDKEAIQPTDPIQEFEDFLKSDAQLSSITLDSQHSSPIAIENVPYQSEKLYDKGIALIGDSGSFVDPMVSPGIELICQQVLWLSELIPADIQSGKFDAKKWKKYDRLFAQAYSDRMDIYQNAYRLMNSYDLSSNWLQLGLLAYFGIFVFLAFLFPKRLKIPFTINKIGRLGFIYMIWRLNSINKRRKRQGRNSNAKPNDVTYSSFYYPTGVFFYTIPLRMFFKWLFRYLKLELKELRYIFKK